MGNKGVRKLLQEIAKAVLLGLASGAAKAIGLLVLTRWLR